MAPNNVGLQFCRTQQLINQVVDLMNVILLKNRVKFVTVCELVKSEDYFIKCG